MALFNKEEEKKKCPYLIDSWKKSNKTLKCHKCKYYNKFRGSIPVIIPCDINNCPLEVKNEK
jgi:hypothetical protein